MLGLVHLEQNLNPGSTFEKLLFLIENAALHEHRPTTLISFIALAFLVLSRFTKVRFSQNWVLRKIPELLIVVVVSTGTLSHCSELLIRHSIILTYA